jgi:hypothetical protein
MHKEPVVKNDGYTLKWEERAYPQQRRMSLMDSTASFKIGEKGFDTNENTFTRNQNQFLKLKKASVPFPESTRSETLFP